MTSFTIPTPTNSAFTVRAICLGLAVVVETARPQCRLGYIARSNSDTWHTTPEHLVGLFLAPPQPKPVPFAMKTPAPPRPVDHGRHYSPKTTGWSPRLSGFRRSTPKPVTEWLSDYLVAELSGKVSLDGRPNNADTSPCATPGEEDFGFWVRSPLNEPLTTTVAQFYQAQGFTTKVNAGYLGGVFIQEHGLNVKYVTLTQLQGSDYVTVSVRLI